MLTLTPELVGPLPPFALKGSLAKATTFHPTSLDEMRPNSVAIHLTKKLIELYFREPDQDIPYYPLQPAAADHP